MQLSVYNSLHPDNICCYVSVAKADAHLAGDLDHRVIHRQELGLAGRVLQRDGHDLPALHSDHTAILLVDDKVCRGNAELRREDSVIRAGRAAALIVPGHSDARFLAGELFKPVGDLIGDGGVPAVLALAAAGFLVKLDIVHRDRAFGAGNDGIALALTVALLDKLSDIIEVVGYLRDKYNIMPASAMSFALFCVPLPPMMTRQSRLRRL